MLVNMAQELRFRLPQIRVGIPVKKHHDLGNSCKGKYLIGAGIEFRDLVIVVMAEDMVGTPALCWRRNRGNREFYI